MGKGVSIKDIAAAANVSIATVSRVINHNGRFSKETEERVLEAIHRCNYVPSQLAKEMITQKTTNVGIIVPDITNEFFTKLISSIERTLFENGYLAFICTTDEDSEIEKSKIQMMASKRVSGLIFLSSSSTVSEEDLGDIPTVFIDRKPVTKADTRCFITSDNVSGGYLATKELIDNGCKKILIMTAKNHISGYQERYKGYAKALKEAGIEKEYTVMLDHLHYQDAYDEMNRILDEGKPEFDGVFACSDWLALGCYKSLFEHGYDVPNDIKIIGFDNISITAFNTVPISTINQQVEKIGEEAALYLMKVINGEDVPTKAIEVPVYLVRRESSSK
ncbi:MAG: LacI family transcriptional regulator [Clostridia bacterium]|nr:LacI family transcriptional regulator [Clostridia bacterium]